jgi:cullin 1
MYSLLARVDGLAPLRAEFERHVIIEGSGAIEKVAREAAKNPKLYVEELLTVYRKFHEFVNGPFKGEAGFIAALDKACRRFINTNAVTELLKDPRRSPELIAKYSDQLLQKSNKDSNFTVLEPLLNDIVCVSHSLLATVTRSLTDPLVGICC